MAALDSRSDSSIADRMEPGLGDMARDARDVAAVTAAATMSIAVSLKRIADTLGHMTTEPCNHYGETFVPAIARAISDGMAGRV